jgi:hypothetical protein
MDGPVAGHPLATRSAPPSESFSRLASAAGFFGPDRAAPPRGQYDVVVMDPKPIRMITRFISNLFDRYVTKGNLIFTFAAVIATALFFFFVKNYLGNIIISNIFGTIYIIILYATLCDDAVCTFYPYFYLFLVAPSLFFISESITRTRYFCIPFAVFFMAATFAFNRRAPFFICAMFVLAEALSLLVPLIRRGEKPGLGPSVRSGLLLLGIAGGGYYLYRMIMPTFYFIAYFLFFSIF